MKLFESDQITRLLIVASDAVVTDALRSSLAVWKAVRHASECVSTVEQALAAAAAIPPDLILLDYGPTERDGLDQLDQLRLARPEIPIIMVSRHGDEQWAVHAIQAGAADHLPFAELNSLLRSAVGLAVERVHALRALDRLNNNLVGIVSHDVRAPAANVVGFADLLLEDRPGSPLTAQQRRMLERIRENGRFILTLTEDLLDTVRISSGSLELLLGRHDVGSLIGESIERCSLLGTNNGVSLRSTCSPGTLFGEFDRPKILQVLNNLTSNALKFSSPGSEVTIGASQTERDVTIRVVDRGQGIPADEIEKLFKKFSLTSTRPTRGEKTTGLGLYIVNEFVTLHKGSLSVESTPKVGSTFSVTLPRLSPVSRTDPTAPPVALAG